MHYSAYCDILGVSPYASLEEIKKVFRQKAKLFHPDINHSPYASSEFIRFKKAFDYIVRYRRIQSTFIHRNSARARAKNYHSSYSNYRRTSYAKEYHQFYRKKKPEVKLEDIFRKTSYGKIIFIAIHLIFALAALLIIVSPLQNVIVNGFDPEVPVISTLIGIVFSEIFGLLLLSTMVISGLNSKTF
jgi:hypothetical protein